MKKHEEASLEESETFFFKCNVGIGRPGFIR